MTSKRQLLTNKFRKVFNLIIMSTVQPNSLFKLVWEAVFEF